MCVCVYGTRHALYSKLFDTIKKGVLKLQTPLHPFTPWRFGISHTTGREYRREKSISSELDNIIHVITSPLSGHCDFISNRLWHHQQNVNRYVKITVLSSFMDWLCCARNKMMYVLSCGTVNALNRVLFWCSFPSLPHNSGNKHQNNEWAHKQFATRVHSLSYMYVHTKWIRNGANYLYPNASFDVAGV